MQPKQSRKVRNRSIVRFLVHSSLNNLNKSTSQQSSSPTKIRTYTFVLQPDFLYIQLTANSQKKSPVQRFLAHSALNSEFHNLDKSESHKNSSLRWFLVHVSCTFPHPQPEQKIKEEVQRSFTSYGVSHTTPSKTLRRRFRGSRSGGQAPQSGGQTGTRTGLLQRAAANQRIRVSQEGKSLHTQWTGSGDRMGRPRIMTGHEKNQPGAVGKT